MLSSHAVATKNSTIFLHKEKVLCVYLAPGFKSYSVDFHMANLYAKQKHLGCEKKGEANQKQRLSDYTCD